MFFLFLSNKEWNFFFLKTFKVYNLKQYWNFVKFVTGVFIYA